MIVEFFKENSWVISLLSFVGTIILATFTKHLDRKLKSNEIIHTNSLSALSISNELQYEKKLNAIEELWKATIKINEYCGNMNTYFTILTPDEYKSCLKIVDLDKLDLDKYGKFNRDLKEITFKIKPFVDSELWNKYNLYETFMLRNIFILSQGIKNNSIQPWYEDTNLKIIYNSLMGKYKLKDYTQIGSFGRIVTTMEELIVLEIKKVLSGQKLSDEMVKKSIQIAKDLKKYR